MSFIGGGVMAEALISGVVEAGIALPDDISVSDPDDGRRSYLATQYNLSTQESNVEVLDGADMVVIAVKPQTLPQVMSDLNGKLGTGHVVLSIVAGATMATLSRNLNHSALIRVMPNTPAQIGEGMSVWTTSTEVSESVVTNTRNILKTLGEELYVSDEAIIDMATALSASGPAYVFLFIEALIDGGVSLGLSRDVARNLTLQTVLGSAQLLKRTGHHTSELKDMVTSPGGTTIEAILTLESKGFRAAVMEAVRAAYKKSRELGK